jgi:hypothetical protein
MRKRVSNHQPNQQLIAIERDLLRALCQSGPLAELSSQVHSELLDYSWQGSDHQTIFEALLRIEGTRGRSSREQLAAQATRIGFPDINWNEYFGQVVEAEGGFKRSVMKLVRKLKVAAARAR